MIKTFVIIGCGRIAQRHAEHIATDGKLIAVCDTIKERADQLALNYGATAYYSIEELLKNTKPDIGAVCTPNGLHAEHSIRLLEAGIHVLCEKPMAIRVSDCKKMIEAAERSGKKLFIVKQNRFNPPVQAVKQLIDDKKLGTLFSFQLSCFWNRNADYYANSWKGTKELDGGTLFTQFSHFIDLLYWMLGDLENVCAFTANYAHKNSIEFEDSGVAILKFGNNITGTLNYTVNSHAKNMEGSLTIFGEKGTVKIGGQYLNELEYQDIEDYKITNLPPSGPANQYGLYQGSMSNHDKIYANLISALIGDTFLTSPFEGMKTVEIIEKIYNSTI